MATPRRLGSMLVLTVLFACGLQLAQAYYCPGLELPDPSVETVTLCDGTPARCQSACCVGDYCIYCDCTAQAFSPKLSASETSLQSDLCIALDQAESAADFCDISVSNLVSDLPTSDSCIQSAAQAYAGICVDVLYGTDLSGLYPSDTPSSDPGSAAIEHPVGECQVVPAGTPTCPTDLPDPACCSASGACTSRADGQGGTCDSQYGVGCCPSVDQALVLNPNSSVTSRSPASTTPNGKLPVASAPSPATKSPAVVPKMVPRVMGPSPAGAPTPAAGPGRAPAVAPAMLATPRSVGSTVLDFMLNGSSSAASTGDATPPAAARLMDALSQFNNLVLMRTGDTQPLGSPALGK